MYTTNIYIYMYLTIGTADVFVITVLLYLTNTGAKQEPTLAVFLTYLLMSYWVFRVVRSDYIQPTVHGSPHVHSAVFTPHGCASFRQTTGMP